jgi:uncharacterized protein with HEPN domain
LREIIPLKVAIEIRLDGGLEFNNETVREYFNENNIVHYALIKSIEILGEAAANVNIYFNSKILKFNKERAVGR